MFPASASLATCLLSLFALQGAYRESMKWNTVAVASKSHEGSFATMLTVFGLLEAGEAAELFSAALRRVPYPASLLRSPHETAYQKYLT